VGKGRREWPDPTENIGKIITIIALQVDHNHNRGRQTSIQTGGKFLQRRDAAR
jgi:hypothetical protein